MLVKKLYSVTNQKISVHLYLKNKYQMFKTNVIIFELNIICTDFQKCVAFCDFHILPQMLSHHLLIIFIFMFILYADNIIIIKYIGD